MDRRYSEIIIPVSTHQTATPDAATTLTPPTLQMGNVTYTATGLYLSTDTTNIRFTLDGTTPTTTVGFLLTPTLGVVRIDLDSGASRLRVINVTAANTIQFQWFRC